MHKKHLYNKENDLIGEIRYKREIFCFTDCVSHQSKGNLQIFQRNHVCIIVAWDMASVQGIQDRFLKELRHNFPSRQFVYHFSCSHIIECVQFCHAHYTRQTPFIIPLCAAQHTWCYYNCKPVSVSTETQLLSAQISAFSKGTDLQPAQDIVRTSQQLSLLHVCWV